MHGDNTNAQIKFDLEDWDTEEDFIGSALGLDKSLKKLGQSMKTIVLSDNKMGLSYSLLFDSFDEDFSVLLSHIYQNRENKQFSYYKAKSILDPKAVIHEICFDGRLILLVKSLSEVDDLPF
jgi:stress response protein SCP2